jgi:hypothetical protein
MVSRPRALGVAFLALAVAFPGGPAVVGGAAATPGDEGASATLENVRVGALELETVTIENAVIAELTVRQLAIRDGADLRERPNGTEGNGAVTIADVSFETLTLETVSVDDLETDAPGLEDAVDGDDVTVRDATVESMHADRLTIEDLTVEDEDGLLAGLPEAIDDLIGDDAGSDPADIESLTVERFDVGTITVASMTVGSLERRAGNGTVDGGTDAEPTGDGAEPTGNRTVASLSAGSMTIENASANAATVGETDGLGDALGNGSDAARNDTADRGGGNGTPSVGAVG